jgi:outer membrane protein OmpA-like peptidoglycan-associated protein
MPTAYTVFFILAMTFLHNFGHAQNATPAHHGKTASVEITVTDAHQSPRTGEHVVFKAKKTARLFEGRTNRSGKLLITLPTGDEYTVMLNTINDSTQFGKLPIPPLADSQSYTKPFVIEISYEPAKEFILNDVYFETGKATLQPVSFKQLQVLYEYMKWKDSSRIEVRGHTDNVGNDTDNLTLSQKRSDNVKAWLVQKGINTSRIIAKGYGASTPVADNNTDKGRGKNRRTEIKIL